MLSPADAAVIGIVALVVFGPDKLPGLARQVGRVARDVQNTSQSFIRELEHAADEETSAERQAREIRERALHENLGVTTSAPQAMMPLPDPVQPHAGLVHPAAGAVTEAPSPRPYEAEGI